MKNKNKIICLSFILILLLPFLISTYIHFGNYPNSVPYDGTPEKENVDLKSSGMIPVIFYLCDQNGNPLNTSDLYLYAGLFIGSMGSGWKDFGVPLDVNNGTYEIWVYDIRFNLLIFNEIIDFTGRTTYDVLCNIGNLTINLETREIGEFTIKEQNHPTHIHYFNMDPNTTRVLTLWQSLYDATWFNTEDNSLHIYNSIDMSVNREYTLDGILYYDVNFTLSDQDLNPLDISKYSLYINGIEKEFGLVALNESNILITVKDRFGIIGFNSIVDIEGLSTYNIIVSIYRLQIQHLISQPSNVTIKEITTQEYITFTMIPDEIRMFKLTNGDYEITWINGENSQTYRYDINLVSDYGLTLICYNVYFSIFTFDGIGLGADLVRFYINGIRSDFGNIELNRLYNNLSILDFFGNVIYSENIDLSGETEWNIYVEMYNIEIRNAYNYDIDLVFERNGFTVEITVPAQFSIQYRFILDVAYNITWYKSSDDSYLGNTEITFTKKNLLISFGVSTNIFSEMDTTVIWIVVVVIIVSTLAIVLKYRKQLILYINKKFKK